MEWFKERKDILYLVSALLLAAISAYDGTYRMESLQTVNELVEKAIIASDNGLLVLAAFEWVLIQTLWFTPGVLSGFLIADMLRGWGPFAHGSWWLAYVLVLPWVFGVHLVLAIQGTDYSFVGVFMVIVLTMISVNEMGGGRESFFPVVLVAVGFGLVINWLNMVPALNFIPIIQGDIEVGIKLAAEFLQGEAVLNMMGIFFAVFLFFTSVVSTLLVSVYLRRIALIEQNQAQAMHLKEAELQARKATVLQEMHTLVHDLKTPLTTIRGLNSLVEMATTSDKQKEYCRRIDMAVDKVNAMISEILYDEVRKLITVEELITYVRAHVLVKKSGQQVLFDIDKDLPLLEINVIRMSRVFINLIENAFAATAGIPNAQIVVRAFTEKDWIVFEIIDNGRGIPKYTGDEVWQWGYSTKGKSSGFGLAFVKQIVENHRGEVDLESSPQQGTKITIKLRGGQADEDNDY